ncbi:MAG: response regulator transcription factor [Bacteroidetes bacterium]|nr:response regulator transcription factor [Bacteroidota bacterium]
MKILLADDSDLILERLQEMLSMYEQVDIVGSFTNGVEALEALRILKPDLAIIDLKMPGLSGLEVLNEIRKKDKKLKFIIFTFYTSEYYKTMAIKAGTDYFFSKIDDFEKVSKVVEEMMLQKENYKEYYNKNLLN